MYIFYVIQYSNTKIKLKNVDTGFIVLCMSRHQKHSFLYQRTYVWYSAVVRYICRRWQRCTGRCWRQGACCLLSIVSKEWNIDTPSDLQVFYVEGHFVRGIVALYSDRHVTVVREIVTSWVRVLQIWFQFQSVIQRSDVCRQQQFSSRYGR